MYSYTFDSETGGIILNSTPTNFSKEPRPVYAAELDILGFDKYWDYNKQNDVPYMWAESNIYWYRGVQIAKTKGGDLYTAPELQPVRDENGSVPFDKTEGNTLEPINIEAMCAANEDLLTVIEDSTVKKIVKEYEKFKNKLDIFHVAFSGGKDSGVLLNMCIDYIRKNNLKIRLGVFHMDYEIQYKMTIDYVDRILEANKDILDVYRVCIPFRVATCTSMYQSFWRPWEDSKKNIWVRPMPKKAMTKDDFPFYNTTMWDYEFQMRFAQWIHNKNDAVRTCCLIGIRTQESFNRWRCIYMSRKFQMYHKYKWTSKVGNDIYNAYPIYDWKTTDVWTANGKFQWDYNVLYDLYYRAGVNLERQRVASPFINEAQESLQLYRVLDPNTWGKMVGRVNGVNFTGMYGGTHAMGWQSVKLPEGYTWREFMYFLLSTLPERARKNYLRKLSVSVNFWRTKGGCLSDATIRKLIDAKIPIIVMDNSNYKTLKKPVRMEYQDDIDIPEFKEIPTYKRMCICILKNDHACKYMGFSPTKEEMSKRSQIMEQYRIIVS